VSGNAEYAERVVAGLERDFGHGAIACKVWKNIGMEIRKPSGEFLLVDDPIFDPIYRYLTRSERTVLMHIGEPLACWQPLDPEDLHYGYYSGHPEWHMYNKPEYPSHSDLIDARDCVLERFPQMRVVGAHLGSLEYDVVEVAKRLDRYPNFAVDTSARTKDLAYQERDTVRQFMIAYADRVLFGTDLVIRESHAALGAQERAARLGRVESVYGREFAYYEGGQTMTFNRREVRGLDLPAEVLQGFYHDNAAEWYPGLV
jgi:predicted TIM-barrel fold metal-dependent hydrolase